MKEYINFINFSKTLNLRPLTLKSIPFLLCLQAIIFLSSCGKGGAGVGLSGGGSPNLPDLIVSGLVQAPSGQIAFSSENSPLDKIVRIIIPSANALISGLSFVPDGTTVELDSINDSGVIVSNLSTTTVSGGNYSFDFTKLNLSFSSNLIVRVLGSNSGIQMRAFVGIGITNINPVTEAPVSIVLDTISANPGISLSNFTPQEQNDITASLDLFCTVNNLSSGLDINSTVTNVKSAVLSNSGLMSFITATSAPGQTSIGPGDIGNYMPVSTGNTWILQDQTAPSSGLQTSYTETDSFTGTTNFNGTAMSVLTVTTTGQSATTIQNYFVKNSTGYFEYGDNDPKDLLLPQISPITQLIFPIQPGRTFGQINKKGLNYGQDLDGDGIPETFDLSYSSTYIGFETSTVLAGSFPNSIKITINIMETITLSKNKQQAIITFVEDSWLAPGIGFVKSTLTSQGKYNGNVYFSETDTNELKGAIVGNNGIGLHIKITPATTPVNINYPVSASVQINTSQQFLAQAFDQANNPLYGLTFSWNASPSAVANIDGNGVGTGISVGSTILTASVGGITSNPFPLYVFDMQSLLTCTLPYCDVIYDPLRNKIYASNTQSIYGNGGNSVVTIDPKTGIIESSIPLGNNFGTFVGKLAISDDGQFLYVALDVFNGGSPSASVQRINLVTSSLDIQFPLKSYPSSLPAYGVSDLKVLPGKPHSVAVAIAQSVAGPGFSGLAIFDDGVARPNTIQGWNASGYEIDRIEFSSSSTLYGINVGTPDLYKMSVDLRGVTLVNVAKNFTNSASNDAQSIKFYGGLIYISSGQVIDPSTSIPTIIGTFPISGYTPQLVLDTMNGKAYSIFSDPYRGILTDLSVFSIHSFQLFDSMMIEYTGFDAVDGNSTFIKAGSKSFAFTSNGQTLLFKSRF